MSVEPLVAAVSVVGTKPEGVLPATLPFPLPSVAEFFGQKEDHESPARSPQEDALVGNHRHVTDLFLEAFFKFPASMAATELFKVDREKFRFLYEGLIPLRLRQRFNEVGKRRLHKIEEHLRAMALSEQAAQVAVQQAAQAASVQGTPVHQTPDTPTGIPTADITLQTEGDTPDAAGADVTSPPPTAAPPSPTPTPISRKRKWETFSDNTKYWQGIQGPFLDPPAQPMAAQELATILQRDSITLNQDIFEALWRMHKAQKGRSKRLKPVTTAFEVFHDIRHYDAPYPHIKLYFDVPGADHVDFTINRRARTFRISGKRPDPGGRLVPLQSPATASASYLQRIYGEFSYVGVLPSEVDVARDPVFRREDGVFIVELAEHTE